MTSKHLPVLRLPEAPPSTMLRAAAPEPAAPEETGPDWRRIASALWHFKWVVLVAGALGLGAGVAATRVLRPQFVAQATVWIDVPNRREPERGGPIRQSGLLDANAWIDLLRSYVVLDQVVKDLRLYLELRAPEDTAWFSGFSTAEGFRPGSYRLSVDDEGRTYVLGAAKGPDLERGTVGDPVGAELGFRWTPAVGALPAGRTVEFTLATPRDAARALEEQLQVQMDLNGNFLKVELRGGSPRRIAAILNATAERYVKVAADLKRQKLTELTKILDEQLGYAQRNLQDAETALRNYRVQTITLPADRSPTAPSGTEARDPVFARFFDTQLERDQLRRDRDAITRLIAQAADSGVPAGALGVVGAVTRSPELSQSLKELTDKQAELRALRRRYADAYPPVQRLTNEIAELERATIPNLARGLVVELGARERELGREVDMSSRDLRQIPPRAIEEDRLRRGVTLAAETFNTLQGRYTEAKLAAEASSVPDVRILDPAIAPQRPVKNTKPKLLLMGLMGGLALGMVGAILLDRLDPRVRYPEQVSRELGLPILGAVPHLRGGDEPAEVVEALRGVCLNMMHAHGLGGGAVVGGGPLVVTLTSPGAGDGKSFIAANLALTFADGGRRTLLVDGDLRRGVLHRRFNITRQPGLADYLREEVAREHIVQSTAYPWLYVIGCGTRTHRAPELLGSATMGRLMGALRSEYDVILIDSPPLGAGVDPFILGTVAENLVLVLRTGVSLREVAGAKLEVLSRLPVRILGAVLNDVPEGASYRYYSYYLPGYDAVDEPEGAGGAGALPTRPRLV